MTLEEMWSRYDEIKSTNPHAAARFAIDVRLFETARPTATPATEHTPIDTTGEDPRWTEYRELRKVNPVLAARFAAAKGLI